MSDDSDSMMGDLDVAFLLMIALVLWVVWAGSCQESSRSEQSILPVHQPQQYRPVPQLPPRPPPPSQSYQSSPYTPPAHQPEQHRPVPQLSPRPPPPSQSHQSSPYTPPVHQPEQRQPVFQPPPYRLPPSQSYRSSPHRSPSPHGLPTHEDDNQEDHPNEYYIGLRARANKEGDEMARCFSESHDTYDRGDRAAAKDLSNEGENHKQKMEQLNKEASNWIYHENNRDSKPGEIDLHGLYVKEAIAYTDAALEEAKLRGDSEIRLIVGKGLHSEGGEPKVGPAIKDLMHTYQLVAEFDPSNSGVLVVELN
ncbi:uncharacterized protein ARMOST_17789 [Armillaria ostoyae]|uniref:Smr domain-containing protein n=1 Tax=Armillaria ostoyae TaxID=47428 RepID=A0A284RZZ4_ARMOS|nr:uncharacterized protein ARMOST_17789 [Armillaria ostoyae]